MLKKVEELFDHESAVSIRIEENNKEAVAHIKNVSKHLDKIKKVKL